MLTEIQVNNLKELWNSLQVNVQDIARQLGDLHSKIKDAEDYLQTLRANIGIARDELEAVQSHSHIEKSKLAHKAEEITKAAKEVLEAREALKNEREEQPRLLARFDREKENKTAKISALNLSIKELEEKCQDSLEQIDIKQKEILGLNTIIAQRDTDLRSVESALNERKKEFQSTCIQYEKTFDTLKERENNIESEILVKQRSLDGFKDNKERMVKELSEKQKDLQILTGRLRKLYQAIGKDFKL